MAYHEVAACRLSGSTDLRPVLHLGEQALTGVFPERGDEPITRGPLELVFCPDSGLLQLHHSYDLAEMYGLNYGYRSGLNRAMVDHLEHMAQALERRVSVASCPLRAGDIVVDIGSNDATLLRSYRTPGLRRLGIDPTGVKFRGFYPPDVKLVPDFFSADAYRGMFGTEPARLVTSIAMFYDLEDPLAFVREVASILAPNGLWHFEQSYMPSMLAATAYDTVCHEHLEYYALRQIQWMTERAGLKIVDVALNDVNGGSFAVTVAHAGSPAAEQSADDRVAELLRQEEELDLCSEAPYHEFAERVFKHRDELRTLIRDLTASGKTVYGYGASTKGNVLLQFCGLTPDDIPAIAEVNPFKFGRFTPGTGIPIIPEAEARALQPDYFLVLPWHFRPGILAREREYLANGGRLIFPLPDVTVVGRESLQPHARSKTQVFVEPSASATSTAAAPVSQSSSTPSSSPSPSPSSTQYVDGLL
jgi:hypothetical protein